MRFEVVRERLRALPRDLPAPPAILMPIRVDAPEEWRMEPPRKVRLAAVLVLLFPDEEGVARVLLTARVPHLAAHAGEVSFPGGRAEPEDADPIQTALREAAEEVALDPLQCGCEIAGSLERVTIPVSSFRITPVVALASRRPIVHPAPDEVARIIDPPVEAFLPDAPVELEERVIRERLVRYGVYPVAGERVWGATARMLGQLGALVASAGDLAGDGAAAAPVRPSSRPPGGSFAPRGPIASSVVRPATPADQPRIHDFLEALAPELAHSWPPASELLVADVDGELVGLASWAPWDRDRSTDDPRGFAGLDLPADDHASEVTLLAVAPEVRGIGLGRRLANSIADAAARAGSRRLLAWTLADTAVYPSSQASRAFFRAAGFTDLAVDRQVLARGEDRLLLSRNLIS